MKAILDQMILAPAAYWSSIDLLGSIVFALMWSLIAFLIVATVFLFWQKTSRYSHYPAVVGVALGILVVISASQLANLQSKREADLKKQIKAAETFSNQIKIQLQAARIELLEAETNLARLEVKANDLEVKLVDTRDRLTRAGRQARCSPEDLDKLAAWRPDLKSDSQLTGIVVASE